MNYKMTEIKTKTKKSYEYFTKCANCNVVNCLDSLLNKEFGDEIHEYLADHICN